MYYYINMEDEIGYYKYKELEWVIIIINNTGFKKWLNDNFYWITVDLLCYGTGYCSAICGDALP